MCQPTTWHLMGRNVDTKEQEYDAHWGETNQIKVNVAFCSSFLQIVLIIEVDVFACLVIVSSCKSMIIDQFMSYSRKAPKMWRITRFLGHSWYQQRPTLLLLQRREVLSHFLLNSVIGIATGSLKLHMKYYLQKHAKLSEVAIGWYKRTKSLQLQLKTCTATICSNEQERHF